MPFTASLEMKVSNFQLFSIGVDDVDRERERLAIVLTEDDGTESAIVCILENDDTGQPQLRVDRAQSDPEFIENLDESVRDNLDVEKPDELNVYVVADTVTDSADLMLTVPPTIAVSINGKLVYNEFEPEDDDGGVITVESRTIN